MVSYATRGLTNEEYDEFRRTMVKMQGVTCYAINEERPRQSKIKDTIKMNFAKNDVIIDLMNDYINGAEKIATVSVIAPKQIDRVVILVYAENRETVYVAIQRISKNETIFGEVEAILKTNNFGEAMQSFLLAYGVEAEIIASPQTKENGGIVPPHLGLIGSALFSISTLVIGHFVSQELHERYKAKLKREKRKTKRTKKSKTKKRRNPAINEKNLEVVAIADNNELAGKIANMLNSIGIDAFVKQTKKRDVVGILVRNKDKQRAEFFLTKSTHRTAANPVNSAVKEQVIKCPKCHTTMSFYDLGTLDDGNVAPIYYCAVCDKYFADR